MTNLAQKLNSSLKSIVHTKKGLLTFQNEGSVVPSDNTSGAVYVNLLLSPRVKGSV